MTLLHLVYRSYGGENNKNRPPFYSKLLTLTSFVRAAARVPEADVIFLNDGPVPSERLAVMEGAGRVLQIAPQPVGMRGSYRFGLRLPDQEGWADTDIVCYVEDDYLFTEDGLVALREAAEQLDVASYFSLYGSRPDYSDPEAARIEFSLPPGWTPQPDQLVGDRVWFNQPSTASTFAARVGALREDLPIFYQAMIPFRRRFLDHETCLLYQGQRPFRGWDVLVGLPDDFVPSVRGVARTLFLVPFRLALNLRTRKQPHYLYALTPNAATHLEYPVVSPDRDWRTVAADVAVWAEASGWKSTAEEIRGVVATV